MAMVHRRRAGVIREALDRDVPPADADDAFDDADVDLLSVEHAALFDVQLEVGADVARVCACALASCPDRRR